MGPITEAQSNQRRYAARAIRHRLFTDNAGNAHGLWARGQMFIRWDTEKERVDLVKQHIAIRMGQPPKINRDQHLSRRSLRPVTELLQRLRVFGIAAAPEAVPAMNVAMRLLPCFANKRKPVRAGQQIQLGAGITMITDYRHFRLCMPMKTVQALRGFLDEYA